MLIKLISCVLFAFLFSNPLSAAANISPPINSDEGLGRISASSPIVNIIDNGGGTGLPTTSPPNTISFTPAPSVLRRGSTPSDKIPGKAWAFCGSGSALVFLSVAGFITVCTKYFPPDQLGGIFAGSAVSAAGGLVLLYFFAQNVPTKVQKASDAPPAGGPPPQPEVPGGAVAPAIGGGVVPPASQP